MYKRYATDEEERRSHPMSFKIKPSHFDRLEKLSRKEDRSKSAIVERALTDYFKKMKA